MAKRKKRGCPSTSRGPLLCQRKKGVMAKEKKIKFGAIPRLARGKKRGGLTQMHQNKKKAQAHQDELLGLAHPQEKLTKQMATRTRSELRDAGGRKKGGTWFRQR